MSAVLRWLPQALQSFAIRSEQKVRPLPLTVDFLVLPCRWESLRALCCGMRRAPSQLRYIRRMSCPDAENAARTPMLSQVSACEQACRLHGPTSAKPCPCQGHARTASLVSRTTPYDFSTLHQAAPQKQETFRRFRSCWRQDEPPNRERN